MKFFCLHEGFYEGVQGRLDQLKAACDTLNIDFEVIDSMRADYSNLPLLGKGDLLYNATRGSETLETILLNKDVTTFYVQTPSNVIFNSDTIKYSILHQKAGIPAPKTVFNITDNRRLLKNYVDYLDGFPLILKAAGSTRGIGTIKVETWQNLVSTVDYLVSIGSKFILRQFIQATGVGRCRVLGNEVIQTYEFPLIDGDFRTASQPFEQLPDLVNKDFSVEIKNVCVEAARIANTEYGAVDIIIDKEHNFYVLEINFPPGLPLNWKETENKIALQMLEHLRNKAGRK